MKCPKCDADNTQDSQFCKKCATSLTGVDESQRSITKTIQKPVEELTTGSTFARRYQIIEELGKGGMGKVYKAVDTRIKEKIALKLIKPEISSDSKTLERFGNELKLARKIVHKNVGRMFDINEEKGTHYITMEYVSGQDLKGLIRQSGQLAIGTTISIAKQICEGLSEAHKVGVVHRDLKPNNIMIDREGEVRIMDFGIARSLETKGITGAGVMIGTPEYMSPEQVEAKETDQRSDIYSLGIILYEMVTGQVPFEGDTPFSIGVKQKSENPRPPKEINDQIPEDLNRVILKCMEKEKESRYQGAGELHSELMKLEKGIPTEERAIAKKKPLTSREITVTIGFKKLLVPVTVAVAVITAALLIWQLLPKKDVHKTSIAVISFENQTGESSLDYLQKAIPNLLITSLEQSRNIQVMTWERMHDLLKQMGKAEVEVVDRDLGFELCRKDGVDAIVLGSFIMAGDMFATDVKVLDITTKNILKSTSSKGEGVASILRNQIDELSREISKGIGISAKKTERGSQSIADVTTESMEAYQCFLKGKEAYEKFYFEDAKRYLEKALELDPRFSAAYLFLGHTYFQQGDRDSGIEAYTQAKAYSDHATEKERLFIEAEYANWIEGDSEKRFRLLQELAEKYPKEKQVHYDLGFRYQSREMFQDAIEAFQKALELDPNWGHLINNLAYAYSDMGDYDKAIAYFQRYADVSPGDANPIDSMAEQYFRMGRLDEAIAKYEEALEIKPDFDSGLRLAMVYALKEDYTRAFEQLDLYIAWAASPGRKAEGHLWKGIFSFILGKREDAFISLIESEKLADRIRTGTVDFTKGWMHYELREFELSREYLQQAWDLFLSFFPDTPSWQMYAEYGLGLVDVRQGRMAAARSRLDKMNSLYARLESPRAKNLGTFRLDWLQAEILLADGSAGDAVEILVETVPQTVPNLQTDTYGPYNMPFRRDTLARAYHQSGRLDEAIAEYERLVEFVPGEKDWHLIHPLYYLLLGRLYEEKGIYEKFLTLWKDADPGIAEVEDARERLAALKNQ